MEQRIVKELSVRDDTVNSTVGGLFVNPENLASLRQHALVVCLWASPETIWSRVKNQNHRPLLNEPEPLEKIRHLLAERSPCYKRCDVLVSTELRSPREVAQQVLHQFRRERTAQAAH